MLPITPNGAPTPAATQTEAELKDRTTTPRGVLEKNLKTMVYVGVVLVLVLAMFVSSGKKKSTATAPTKDAAPAPQVQDNTANNVQAFHTQLDTERQQRQQREASLAAASGTPAQQAAAASYGATGQPVPCVPGQVCNPSAAYAAAAATAGSSKFPPSSSRSSSSRPRSGNGSTPLASSRTSCTAMQPSRSRQRGREALRPRPAPTPRAPSPDSPPASSQLGQQERNPQSGAPAAPAGAAQSYKRAAEVNVSAASGQPYVIFEGLSLDTVLMNRLDGDAAGPVKVLVSDPVYSHDHQHVLIPEGTMVWGRRARSAAQASASSAAWQWSSTA